MQRWTRGVLAGVAVLGLAAGLLAVGAAAGSPPGVEQSTETSSAAGGDSSTTEVARLQAELARVPGNYTAWSELGFAYVTQARLTADPTLYTKADGAFVKSLELHPENNDAALTGQASLAASRHEFAEALALTDRALAINDFSATTYAVRTDALVELGRYEEARTSVQRLLDLRPGSVDALARASYSVELQGKVNQARTLLEQAAASTTSPADEAFARYYLGELAFSNGDLAGAGAAYEAGLETDPGHLPLVAGRAKVLAATGDTGAAAAQYRRVVERLPQPEFLLALGELLEATGQVDAAQEQYAVLRATQQLYAANGQDVDTELAIFEADHGTPAAALASAEKAYAKRPLAIFTQEAYAWALHAAGRDDEALPLAMQSVRLGLKSPALYYRLGVIAAAAGDRATARTALSKALALNPAFSPLHAPKARALLKTLG